MATQVKRKRAQAGRAVKPAKTTRATRATKVARAAKARKPSSSADDHRNLLPAAFDQAAVGMALRDLHGNWVRVNQKLCDMLGYTAAEFLSLNVSDITPAGERRESTALNERMRQGDTTPYSREKRYLRKDGSTLEATVTISPVLDADGKSSFLLAVIQDISDRKRAYEAVRASDARFRAAFEQAAVGMAIRGLDRRFIRVNRKLCEFLGYTEAELLSMTSLDVTPPEDRDDGMEHQARIGDGTIDQYSREKRYQRKDGKIVWAAVAFTVVRDFAGRADHLVVMIQDITDRKNAEVELARYRENLEGLVRARTMEFERAKEAAENANRAKSMFLSNISHELRTPLNSILGFTQLMKEDTQHPVMSLHREWLDQVVNSGQHLLRLIEGVLDLSRIDSGRMELTRESLPVRETARAALDMVAPRAREHDVMLAPLESEANVNYVLADPARLKQVLTNLLSNAIKFNRPGGAVRMRILRGTENRVAIHISDTGMGMTEAQCEVLFTPFTRHIPQGSVIEGAGVGLALTKSLVELMGGTIMVESTPGEGSTFSIELQEAPRNA